MLRQFAITDDEHGYLKSWPTSIGSWLIIDRFITADPREALRWRTSGGAYKALRAHLIKVGHWRVVPVLMEET